MKAGKVFRMSAYEFSFFPPKASEQRLVTRASKGRAGKCCKSLFKLRGDLLWIKSLTTVWSVVDLNISVPSDGRGASDYCVYL